MTGSVNAFREPIIRLQVRDTQGVDQEVEAVVDTGFTGSLTLPARLIASLGLPFRRRGRALLGDGSTTIFNVHEATVLWSGVPRRVPVDEAETDPLIGMSLLYGCELTIQVVDGGRVSIEALSQP